MKIKCGKRKLSDGTMMYVDTRARKIYIGGAECEPSYKTVFQPEKRGPAPDFEHEEFVKCLMNSFKEGYLSKTELDRRIRRGRPATVWTKPIEPVEKKKMMTKGTGDIDEIIANITKLQKKIAPFKLLIKDEENYFPYINTEKTEESSVQNKEDNEESSVENEEDGEESCMQKEDAAYVGSVNDNVFRSSVHTM